MKIAIFEPYPRICGPSMSWVGAVRTGFRRLGHEAELVTFTKSGKASTQWGRDAAEVGFKRGWKWAPTVPDVVAHLKDAKATLDRYDLIVFPEPKCPSLDNDANRERERHPNALPTYLKALASTSTRWVTALHGCYSQYTEQTAPFMDQMLALPNFTGVIVAHSLGFVGPAFLGLDIAVYPWLPYESRFEFDADVPLTRVIGFKGRFVPNKGPQLLADLAARERLPRGYNVELWGAGAIGMGPNPTYLVGRMLSNKGFTMSFDEDTGTKFDILRPFPWRGTRLNANPAQTITYGGAFNDPLEVARRFEVSFHATAMAFSRDLIEYVGLEAMDAGCQLVAAEHLCTAADYVVDAVPLEQPSGMAKRQHEGYDDVRPWDDGPVVEAIHAAAGRTDTQKVVRATVNRQLIRSYHAPEKFAAYILEVA